MYFSHDDFLNLKGVIQKYLYNSCCYRLGLNFSTISFGMFYMFHMFLSYVTLKSLKYRSLNKVVYYVLPSAFQKRRSRSHQTVRILYTLFFFVVHTFRHYHLTLRIPDIVFYGHFPLLLQRLHFKTV